MTSTVQRGTQAIEAARIACILSMSYVHLHFFPLEGTDSLAFRVRDALLVDLLGRSSVPLLSAISGFLIVSSLARKPYMAFVRGKAASLLLPMVLWNGIALALFGPVDWGASSTTSWRSRAIRS